MKSLTPALANMKTCTGCLACVDVCPAQAIKKRLDPDGHYYADISADKCIGCKECEMICGVVQKGNGNTEFHRSQVYAGWANDKELRKNATSGGAFAALAAQFIKNGGKVVGACFDGKQCRYKLIDNLEDIKSLQGSKYMYCDPEGIYSQIEDALAAGRVLFSGIGCHTEAVLAYFRTSRNKDRLYTIDMICGGIPSSHLVDSYLIHNPDVQQIVSFRTKDKYELKVIANGEIAATDPNELPLGGFCSELTNRYSCYDCKFCNPHRHCDITIGDLWNKELFADERSNGISSIIVHSENGKQLLDSSEITVKAIKWTDIVYTNGRLIYGKRKIRFPRRILTWSFGHLPYSVLEKMYGIRIRKYDVPWMIYRVLRAIANRAEKKKTHDHLDRVIKKYKL